MGKQKKTLEEDMDDVFANWAVGPEARKNLELYQPDPSAVSRDSAQADKEEDSNTPASSAEQRVKGSKTEGQNRPAKPSGQKRTFRNRPDDPEVVVFTPIDHIRENDFFSYYGTLYDVMLPQLHPYSGLILSVLFQQSYGSGRNWCQMSFSEIARIINVSRNTVRTYLKPLIGNGWVCILSDGYREATTYGVRIPHETDEE